MDLDHGAIESATASAHSRLEEQMDWLRSLPADFVTVLDVGAGLGAHSKWFLDSGRRPVALDRYGDAFAYAEIELIRQDLESLEPSRQFDAVFCSHVLEHFPDPAVAVRKMRSLIRPDGYLLVVVPPYSPVSVNYHWHIGWNCTQLALFLVAAGFDCSEATFVQVGQNVCGWGRKRAFEPTGFNLRRSLPYLPKGLSARFYVDGGYDFLPGDIAFADPGMAEVEATVSQISLPALPDDRRVDLDFEPGSWRSAEQRFAPLDLTTGPVQVFIEVTGPEVAFRIAVGSGPAENPWAQMAERYLSAKPGLTFHEFRPRDYRPGAAPVNFRNVTQISVGGSTPAPARLRFWCRLPDGQWFFPPRDG